MTDWQPIDADTVPRGRRLMLYWDEARNGAYVTFGEVLVRSERASVFRDYYGVGIFVKLVMRDEDIVADDHRVCRPLSWYTHWAEVPEGPAT